ncbi:MAG: alpha/beta fold hydrolase [Thermofilaceae archaeon]
MGRAVILLSAFIAAYAVLSLGLLQLESGVEEWRGYIFVDVVPVYYAEWSPKSGTTKGVVVLLHGLGGSLEMMKWLGVELARSGYRAIAYDNLGHGRSGSRIAAFNGTAAFPVYLRLLESLGVRDEEVTLVGHSMGGFFAQEFAKRDPRVVRVIVVASRPYLDKPIERVVVFAALDEIFTVTSAEGWTVVILPHDDHLTVLYNPALADAVLSRLEGDGYENRAPQRLTLTLARSAFALAATLAAVSLLAPRLRKPQAQSPGSLPLAKLAAAFALAAPLAFPLYLLMAPAVSLIAAYVLAVLYTQTLALILVQRPRPRFSTALIKGLPGLVAASIALALIVYVGLHEALQPFFNVEPSSQRAPLMAAILALSLLPCTTFEPLARLKLANLPPMRGLAVVIALRAASFLSAYATARLLLGPQGLSGYLLIVTFVSLTLLLPLDAAAQVWLHRTKSWTENAAWLAVVHSALLAAVTPLT